MKKITFAVIFFVPLNITWLNAMEEKGLPLRIDLSAKTLESQYKAPLFNFKEEFEKGKQPHDVFSMNMVITPDNKNLIIARSGGRIYIAPIDAERFSSNMELLYTQNSVIHVPMVAVGGEPDKIWSLVSAGNYIGNENKRCSQIVVRRSGSDFSWCRDIKSVIQSIAVDSLGKKVAIAHEKSVRILSLIPGENKEEHISVNTYKSNEIIADMDFNNEGDKLIVCFNKGRICLVDCYNKPYVLKSVSIDTPIDKIHYADVQKILYSFVDGKVMIFDLYDFVDNQSSILKPQLFADDSFQGECVSFDQARQVGFIRWTKKAGISSDVCKIIQAKKRLNDLTLRSIFLSVKELRDSYSYASYEGALKEGHAFFVQCALFGNRVIAIGTEGDVFVWEIPSPCDLLGCFSKESCESIKTSREHIELSKKLKFDLRILPELQEEKVSTKSPRSTRDTKKDKRSSDDLLKNKKDKRSSDDFKKKYKFNIIRTAEYEKQHPESERKGEDI